MLYKNTRAFINGEAFEAVDVLTENGVITNIGPDLCGDGRDMGGMLLLPGLIDVHTHGRMGLGYSDGESAVRAIVRDLPKTGVTAVCAAIGGAGAAAIHAALAGVDAVRKSPEAGGAQVLGAHLEGPFLADTNLGAIARDSLHSIDMAFYREMVGKHEDAIRLVSLSPELPGAAALIEYLSARGITVSAAHSSCTYETLMALRNAGLTHITHLFNAMVPLHHRAPGLPGAALAGDFTVELICDGVHLHQGILQLVSKAKDPKQICLITDATQGTGMPDGEYALGSTAFIVKNGIARMKETGALAGSTLELDAALRHMMAVSGAKTEDVINMATLVPAREAGQTDRGRIACGCRADLVFFDEAFFPVETIVQGETVWQKH